MARRAPPPTGSNRGVEPRGRTGGRARVLRDALVTEDRYRVGRVVCVQDKAMKQAWYIATSSTTATARALMTHYAKRWSIECGLRDTKNLRFGMGMGVHSRQHPRAARPAVAARRPGDRALDAARRRRRGTEL